MSIFTLDKQLENIRTEFLQKLEDLRHSIRDQVHAELASSTQALGQTLTGEIQGLPGPLDHNFATRIQALADSLAEQIQQPPDFSEIRTEFTHALKTLELALLKEIQQSRVSSELSQISEKLEQLPKQVQEISSSTSGQLHLLLTQASELSASMLPLSPVPRVLTELQEQVSQLLHSVSQLSPLSGQFDELQARVNNFPRLVSKLSPVHPTDGQETVDQIIEMPIQAALGAINALSRELNSWANELQRTVSELQRKREVEQEAQIDTQQVVDKVQSLLRSSRANEEDGGEHTPVDDQTEPTHQDQT